MAVKNRYFLFVSFIVLTLVLFGCTAEKAVNEFEKDPTLKRNWNIISFTPEFTSINGLSVYYYFPKDPKGVIYFFHGTGGSAKSWFVKVEDLNFIEYAVSRGYAVVSTESKDRTEGKWVTTKDPSTNDDIKQWIAVETFLKKEGLLTSGLKRCGVGMSRGSTFVAYTGGFLKFDGLAMYNGQALQAELENSDYLVPTFIHISEQDVKGNQDTLKENFAILQKRGVRSVFFEKKVEVLTKDRFTKIPNVPLDISELMFNNFVTTGYVDVNGIDTGKLASVQTEDRGIMFEQDKNGLFGNLPEEYQKNKQDFGDQIRVVLADHMFHSGYAKETIDFFENK